MKYQKLWKDSEALLEAEGSEALKGSGGFSEAYVLRRTDRGSDGKLGSDRYQVLIRIRSREGSDTLQVLISSQLVCYSLFVLGS
jgi:hypothetical protein